MARAIPPEDDDELEPALSAEARCVRYWKKASRMYSLACSAETAEVKALYMRVAMSWAAMANELERTTAAAPPVPDSRPGDRYRH